jgi:1,4-alpha-glucan branching enzyme
MRKLFLIAAIVLISASAQAGTFRGLTMAANDPPAATDPTADQTKTEQTKNEQIKPDQTKTAPDKRVEKRRHTRESTEARVIYELHRHGIYW